MPFVGKCQAVYFSPAQVGQELGNISGMQFLAEETGRLKATLKASARTHTSYAVTVERRSAVGNRNT